MLQPNFTPFPGLVTKRLLLRALTTADAPEIFFLRSDHRILKFLAKEPAASQQEAEAFIELISNKVRNNDSILWGIALKEDPGKVIGTICFRQLDKENFRADIGYLLSPEYWNKGIMKEAILGTLAYGFGTMGLHSVAARLNPGNKASAAVLASTGFIKEAHFREDFFYKGTFEDTLVYSRLADSRLAGDNKQ